MAVAVCSDVSYGAQVVVRNGNDALAGSLRQAIHDAAPGDTIAFAIPKTSPAYNAETGIFTIGLTDSELLINKNLTIDGGGQKIVIRRASGIAFRVFNITTGTVTLSRLTISNGSLQTIGGSGGGIRNSGTLTLLECTLRDHFSGNTPGGAVYNDNSLTVRNCTFFANGTGVNSPETKGGAIANFGPGTLTVSDSTIYNNQAPLGAGIYNRGTARVRNSIIAGNPGTAGGSVYVDVDGNFISEGYNLLGNAMNSTGFSSTGDQAGATPSQVNLSPLRDHGGPTHTMRPQPGSLAIDQGNRGIDASNQLINVDQRGYPRPINLPVPNAVGGDGSDIGAVESAAPQSGPTFIVTNTHSGGDNDCTTDDCTFLDAQVAAAAGADANTIIFAPGVQGVISGAPSSGFNVPAPLNIIGPGARQLTISGSNVSRIFNIQAVRVTISGVTLANGRATDFFGSGHGGAILNSGELVLSDCAIDSSLAVGASSASGGNGGGLYNSENATAELVRCTFNGNTASTFGGGAIFNAGTVTATNCTFYGNTAPSGGAILAVSNNGNSLTTLRNCSIVNNTATSTGSATAGGGGYYGEGAVGNTLHHFSNTIVAGNNNAVNPDLRGYVTSEGHNLVGNLGQAGSGSFSAMNGDKVGVAPNLGSFGNHGGLTNTVSLLANSPAINMGSDVLAPARDQRHYSRNGTSDIGAFEFNGTPPPPPALVGLVSRKTHGSSGTFDIDLLTQTECRSGGSNGNYQVVATFAEPVSVSGVSVNSVDEAAVATQSGGGTAVTIYLAGVTGAQRAQITLHDVTNGTSISDVLLSLPVLIGDTTGNASVTASDIGQVKAQSGQAVSAANFRSDVTANGSSISASDIGLVKARAGTQLP